MCRFQVKMCSLFRAFTSRCSYCRLECLDLGKQSLKGSEQPYKRGSLFFVKCQQ